jgi:hypothetical protein
MVENYKGYVIVVSGVLDHFICKYAPMASVAWREDGKHCLHIIDNCPRRFWNQEEAAKFALREAQKWVDER